MAVTAVLYTQVAISAPNPNFVGNHFSGSGNCVQCHDDLVDAKEGDVSIVKNWSTSMMANATRDPYWQAKVASELYRNPNISDEINDKCTRCHAPMANDAMKKDNVPVKMLDDGMLNPENPYYDHALDGVSCTACHQITDNGLLGTIEGFSGKFNIDEYANPVNRPSFGQYVDPVASQMMNSANFTPKHSPHITDSKMCATCHNVKTPFVDGEGKLVSTSAESEFPEQMVYTEWENSAFNNGEPQEKSCQSCHMPKLENAIKISSRPRNLAPRPGFSKHTFLGANTTMMDILNNNKSELNVTATGFEDAIIDTRELLKTSVTVKIVSNEIVNGKLKVILNIANNIGHKFPTAYPSRRAFIHFQVKTPQGEILFESGKLNTNGSIIGNSGDQDSTTLEPHYDLITSEDQVQIYESIMENTDGDVTHTLLRAANYVKDNRILPQGFDKNIVPNDVAVKGGAFTDDNFSEGQDTITYLVDIGTATTPVITAELKYQPLSYGHLQDMFKDANNVKEVSTFKGYFEKRNIRSELISTVTGQAIIVGPVDPVDPVDPTNPDNTDNATSTGGSFSLFMMLALMIIGFGKGLFSRIVIFDHLRT